MSGTREGAIGRSLEGIGAKDTARLASLSYGDSLPDRSTSNVECTQKRAFAIARRAKVDGEHPRRRQTEEVFDVEQRLREEHEAVCVRAR
jgi:hypothetical protein